MRGGEPLSFHRRVEARDKYDLRSKEMIQGGERREERRGEPAGDRETGKQNISQNLLYLFLYKRNEIVSTKAL